MAGRLREAWRARKARKARVNQQLAAADAQVPGQLDRWDRERYERIEEPGVWGDERDAR